jgi:hypothetical protein
MHGISRTGTDRTDEGKQTEQWVRNSAGISEGKDISTWNGLGTINMHDAS